MKSEKKIEHLASFPQMNPNPVIEVDANGTVTFSNAATAEVLKTLEIEDDARIFLPGGKVKSGCGWPPRPPESARSFTTSNPASAIGRLN